MTRRCVVNLVCLGNRVVTLMYGNSLRPLHTSVCNPSSQPKCGFKPEKVAVVTKTTRYEFEQQRYRYAGLSEEDLKQLVGLPFTSRHACKQNSHLPCHLILSLYWIVFAVSVFLSFVWRAPVTAACWKDTTSTPTMWNILWRAWGKMCAVTGRLAQPHSWETAFLAAGTLFVKGKKDICNYVFCRKEGIEVRVVKRGEYDKEVVRWADAIISAGGKHFRLFGCLVFVVFFFVL